MVFSDLDTMTACPHPPPLPRPPQTEEGVIAILKLANTDGPLAQPVQELCKSDCFFPLARHSIDKAQWALDDGWVRTLARMGPSF